MWRDDHDASAWLEQAVEFFNGANDIPNMLNQMDGANFAERVIPKGKWKMIEIGNDVGLSVAVSVNPNGARKFLDSTPHVKHGAL